MADDVCAVTADENGSAKVIPGFPRLKLWADALKKLEKDDMGLIRVRLAQDFQKYFVPFDHTSAIPTPARSFFLLKDTNTDDFEVSELTGMERIEPHLNHTYRPRFLEGLGGIIWPASYPKSGNTWFRVFLTNLRGEQEKSADINDLHRTPIASARGIFDDEVGLEASDMTADEIDRLRPEVYEKLAADADETLFMKVRDAYTRVDAKTPLFPKTASQGPQRKRDAKRGRPS